MSMIDQRDPNKWIGRFFTLAKFIATWSKDPEQQVGAVVVSPNMRKMSPGYNGFPHGIADTDERLNNKDIKRPLIVHAEINAMDSAQVDLTGWAIFITKPCCHTCALSIISRGITRIYMPPLEEQSNWYPLQQLAFELLKEAGLEINFVTENLQ